MDNTDFNIILVVAAHPDDEILGCGGTIAYHRNQGHSVHVLWMADGVTSRAYDPRKKQPRKEELEAHKDQLAQRRQEAVEACKLLGVPQENLYFLNLPDQRLDMYPLLDLVKYIEEVKIAVKPDLIYTHYWNDLNLDHRLTAQAVLTAFRPKPEETNNPVVRHFEVPESTYLAIPKGKEDFVPNIYINISSTIDQKLKALGVYESEKRHYPDLRSEQYIREVASRRGTDSSHSYAEAFIEVSRNEFELRPAAESDAQDLWEWRNHPQVLKYFFDTQPVPWGHHVKWLIDKLSDKNTAIYIAMHKGEKIGVIRIEDQKDIVDVSVNLNPDFMGRGLGTTVIKQGTERFFAERKSRKSILARIKKDNFPSQRAFARAGYVLKETSDEKMVYERRF